MQVTRYFAETRKQPDRQMIADDWIARAVSRPEHVSIQAGGRLRQSVRIDEAERRMLRVVLLPDVQTVHNAFFDRSFQP